MAIPQPDIEAARRVADKYISRNGETPEFGRRSQRSDPLAVKRNLDLLRFLAALPEKQTYKGVSARAAFTIACEIIGCGPTLTRRRLEDL